MGRSFLQLGIRWLVASLAALGLGCAPVGAPATSGPDFGPGGLAVLAMSGAVLQGRVMGPATAAAGYHTAGAELAPMAGSIVYFTTPEERFYAGADGQPLAAFTNGQGEFALEGGPADAAVFMTVLLSGNRRMVGFVRTVRGVNVADVDVATTYVAEFLRAQAAATGRSLLTMPLGELETLVRLTRELLATGQLPVPSLDIAAAPQLRASYVQAFGSRHQALSDAWARVLGRRPLAIEDVPVGMQSDHVLYAVGADAAGNAYVVAGNDSSISLFRRRADGQLDHLIKDAVRDDLGVPAGGIALDREGRVLWPDRDQDGIFRIDPAQPPDFDQVVPPLLADYTEDAYEIDPEGVAIADDGTVYFTDVRYCQVLKVTGPTTYQEVAGSGARGFNGDEVMPALKMRLNSPAGLAWARRDGREYLYVADRYNQRIREIDLASASARTLVGGGTEEFTGGLRGGFEGGVGSSDPLQARLFNPAKVVVDAQGRLFIADAGNHLVRMLAGGRLSIVAGQLPGSAPRLQTGDAQGARLGDVRSLAVDVDGNLLVGDRQAGLRKLYLKFGV